MQNKVKIQLDERSISEHLKKHGMDSRLASVRSMLENFTSQCDAARVSGSIDIFRSDNKTYQGYACLCGHVFSRKDNATRHCKQKGCDSTKLGNVELFKLCCGRHVTQHQIDGFLTTTIPRINQQFDYLMARTILEPFFLAAEKREHTYTHMYLPLIHACKYDPEAFAQKIRADFDMIHSIPKPTSERLLLLIHEKVEIWLRRYCQTDILMVPGNLRAVLQTFGGGEVNGVNQKTLYTIQHNPSSLLPDVKKMLSYAYRRGMFSVRGFNATDDFEVVNFLKDLLLEQPDSVLSQPFLVQFCLMFAFRVKSNDDITMVLCDTVSSVFAKVASTCRAAVCSIICSYSTKALTLHGPALVTNVRDAPVLHKLSPMIWQPREMSERIPKRRKTTQDAIGNITGDQFFFPFDQ
jgi:hypothetical protein